MRKVVMHREVEKKRRQEMSNLHASLRSLLPAAQIIKGKGSVCDVMQEAASHIKKMEKKIEELKNRRDELKRNRWFNSSSNDVDEISSNSVTVNTVTDGMEILIKSSYLGLSRVLGELQKIRDDDDDDDEMDVVSIVSTRLINGIFLHKIHVQARDITYLCVLMLQDRLIKTIK
ncbi:hypothetical protein C2S51_032925 [Perilla frutescens var. frutescens]|nr:hypothetical protein C2S51_032925 [Perilla frutescens var. frutescens]